MPYTFGAASSDQIQISLGQNFGSSGSAHLVAGWWYPTTLTAQNALWSSGSVGLRLEIDTTTTQLRYVSNNSTATQVDTHTGTAITTNKWWFFCWVALKAGAAEFVRVWQADTQNAPTAMTRATVSVGSGTFGAASTNVIIGNNAISGANAWQGQIANISIISQTTSAIGQPIELAVGSGGTTNDMLVIERKLVQALWRGSIDRSILLTNTNTALSCVAVSAPMVNTTATIYRTGQTTASPTLTTTVTGAIVSADRSPQTAIEHWPIRHTRGRR